jgi:hypothetical protein
MSLAIEIWLCVIFSAGSSRSGHAYNSGSQKIQASPTVAQPSCCLQACCRYLNGVGYPPQKPAVCGPKPSFWVNRQHLHATTQNSRANVDDSLAGSLFNRPGEPSGR